MKRFYKTISMSTKIKIEYNQTSIFYLPDVLEEDDSSVNFPDNQHEDGHSIAAKQIQRLCPSVDATSLQDKGNMKRKCLYLEFMILVILKLDNEC